MYQLTLIKMENMLHCIVNEEHGSLIGIGSVLWQESKSSWNWSKKHLTKINNQKIHLQSILKALSSNTHCKHHACKQL